MKGDIGFYISKHGYISLIFLKTFKKDRAYQNSNRRGVSVKIFKWFSSQIAQIPQYFAIKSSHLIFTQVNVGLSVFWPYAWTLHSVGWPEEIKVTLKVVFGLLCIALLNSLLVICCAHKMMDWASAFYLAVLTLTGKK